MNKIKILSGHSGCKVILCQKEQLFVRKISSTQAYNKRLIRQYLKQKKFSYSDIKTPQIYNHGYENSLFYFDMEFIQGTTLASYMHTISISQLMYLIEMLIEALPSTSITVKDDSQTQIIFSKKINSLEKILPFSPIITNAFNILKKYNFSRIPNSTCCGDLTLENIIITPKDIYVIDLLDSFYNSWMIDVAKILQDIEVKWAYRYQDITYNLNLRLDLSRQKIINNIMKKFGVKYIEDIYHILLLNLLRILPYTHDANTFNFLEVAIKKLLILLRGGLHEYINHSMCRKIESISQYEA